MASQFVWIWTLSAILLAWMAFYILKKTKTKTMESATAMSEERRRENVVADVVIVGAGVAGSALAYALAKDGWRVHVIERDLREPDRMVGELMQPGGRLMLIKLGLNDCLEEIDAQKINGLTLYKDGKHSELSFPYNASGRCFHHGRFIRRLRQKAASLPNVWLEEGTVTSLIEERGVIKGVIYKSKTGQEAMAFASLTVVCDGSHSTLRRSLCDPKVDVQSYMVGFISKNCRLESPNSVHLIMSKPSCVLLYQISSTEVRCVVEVVAQKPPTIANGNMSTFLEKIMAPQIPPKLYDIFVKAIKEGNIKTVPTKRIPAFRCNKKGVIAIGDAFNMRHPIIAGGMMLALSDIVILRDLLRPLHNLDDANKVFQVLNNFYRLRKPRAATTNTLANAFHEVLVASADQAKEELRESCFEYMRRGGKCTSGMMALLGGLNPQPLSLMLHLSAITLSAVVRLLFPFPSPRRFQICLKLFLLASSMVGPSLRTEGVMQMIFPKTAAAYGRSPPSNFQLI